jgi:hypothetical protein
MLTGAVSLAAVCLILCASSVPAQTLLVNYDFASLNAGTPCTAMPLSTAPGVTSIFSASQTCTASSGDMTVDGEAYAGNAYNPGVRLLSAGAASKDYFQFKLDGVSAFRDYKLFFQAQRITAIDVQYSLDGVNFTDFKRLSFGPIQPLYHMFFVDLSSAAEIQNQPTVYIRLQGYTSSPVYGYWLDIDNFQVQATATVKKRKRVRFIDPSLSPDGSR